MALVGLILTQFGIGQLQSALDPTVQCEVHRTIGFNTKVRCYKAI